MLIARSQIEADAFQSSAAHETFIVAIVDPGGTQPLRALYTWSGTQWMVDIIIPNTLYLDTLRNQLHFSDGVDLYQLTSN